MTETPVQAPPLFDEQVWEASEDANRSRELAEQDPVRFLWAADAEKVVAHGDARLHALLLPSLREAELSVALAWLRQPGFLDDDQAILLLEERLEGAEASAGWFALAEALKTLDQRGQRWKTARHLERLLERFWLDADEADAVEKAAAGFMDSALLAALLRHEPWRSDPARLTRLSEHCSTRDLARNLRSSFGLERETAERLRLALWATLSRRADGGALEHCASFLASSWDEPIGQAGGLDVVLALQRVHGDEAVPDLVAVFLSGTHRAPIGELIERWLLTRAEAALGAALELLPDWMPRFESSAMDRLCWRLLPRLDDAAKGRIRDLAELAGGDRGAMVQDELEAME